MSCIKAAKRCNASTTFHNFFLFFFQMCLLKNALYLQLLAHMYLPACSNVLSSCQHEAVVQVIQNHKISKTEREREG